MHGVTMKKYQIYFYPPLTAVNLKKLAGINIYKTNTKSQCIRTSNNNKHQSIKINTSSLEVQ